MIRASVCLMEQPEWILIAILEPFVSVWGSRHESMFLHHVILFLLQQLKEARTL